jgi:hypothetical protein
MKLTDYKYFIYLVMHLLLVTPIKAQTFIDVAGIQNINETYSDLDDFIGGGLSFYDFDNDGWDDLVFLHLWDTMSVYRNNQGVFESINLAIYDTGQAKQVLWVDYDNDGLNDLFVSYLYGYVKLYKNFGGLNFVDYTVQASLHHQFGANHSITFGDYDRDGFLDLFIGRYSYQSDNSVNGEKNALLRNNGNGTFSEVTLPSGIDVGINQTLASVWMDYNKDGWPDLNVVTDRDHLLNNLFKNNGDNTFTDVAPALGATAPDTHGMSNTVGDFDNDGDLDVYITNIESRNCVFLVNNNNVDFTDLSVNYGVQNMEAT